VTKKSNRLVWNFESTLTHARDPVEAAPERGETMPPVDARHPQDLPLRRVLARCFVAYKINTISTKA